MTPGQVQDDLAARINALDVGTARRVARLVIESDATLRQALLAVAAADEAKMRQKERLTSRQS